MKHQAYRKGSIIYDTKYSDWLLITKITEKEVCILYLTAKHMSTVSQWYRSVFDTWIQSKEMLVISR